MGKHRKPKGDADLVKQLEELRRHHEALDAEAQAAIARPDDLEIHQLKKRKLRLKDELERLNRSASPLNGDPSTPPPRGRKDG